MGGPAKYPPHLRPVNGRLTQRRRAAERPRRFLSAALRLCVMLFLLPPPPLGVLRERDDECEAEEAADEADHEEEGEVHPHRAGGEGGDVEGGKADEGADR